MELQIQDLVSSIKKDGIDSANKEAAAILAEANNQADAIVAGAKAEADKLKQEAAAEIDVFKNSARLSAEQAKRDAVLAFRQEIQKEFEKLLAADVRKALDPHALASWRRSCKTGWRSAPPKRWAQASVWPLRTAPAILTAPTRRLLRCSCPSFGICACKEVPHGFLLLPHLQPAPAENAG